MELPFAKMNGAGNDFIVVDNRSGAFELSTGQIEALCDRRRGIGADGLLAVETSAEADFRMRYYNRDGGEAEMCGNGARCIARFAGELGLGKAAGAKRVLRFTTAAGPLEATVEGGTVTVQMTDATSFEKSVSLVVAGNDEIVHVIDTGVPHVIIEEPDVDSIADGEILSRGRGIRTHPRFSPGGTNVDFISLVDDGVVKIRTYERGVEGETLACGTGAVAGAVVAAHVTGASGPITLITRGGDKLTVSFVLRADGAADVRMTGPAAVNFTGSVELPAKERTHGV